MRDFHETTALKSRKNLQYFMITNDDRDLVLWSFDIPGYETHIYSFIKETAMLVLCPRIDNSTYLLPDISLLSDLSSVLSNYDYRDTSYFVKPLSRGFVIETLRRAYNLALVLITKILMSENKARGTVLMRLIDKVDYAEESINKALTLWESKGYGIDPSGIRNAIDSVREVLSRRVGKVNR